jgi:exodeoxyribonuclease-5
LVFFQCRKIAQVDYIILKRKTNQTFQMASFEKYLPFIPNKGQKQVLSDLFKFVNPEDEREVLILKGAAGTGKTSILNGVKRYINENSINCRLAAPTGRAAKVLHGKVQSDVKTVHSMIFIPENLANGGIKFNLRDINDDGHTIYIIDESSMISDTNSISDQFISDEPLLTSLIRYVRKGHENNKIIIVGDPYQLPPVVSNHDRSFSPALEKEYLRKRFNAFATENHLSQIMRQDENSPVLSLASEIKNEIKNGNNMYVKYPSRENRWWEVRDYYLENFDQEQLDKVTVICHTNNDVNWWNNSLRNEIFTNSSNLLCKGELVTVHKNTWTNKGLIYNGDVGIVKSFNPISRNCAGLNFSECKIEFTNSNESFTIEKLVCWESLLSKKGNLHQDQERQLYAAAMKSNPKFRASQNVLDDEFLNAFRLRYGYSSTCHKAQGGEWDTVFIHPYLRGIKRDRAKWMYTACTRARNEVFSWCN